jgi:hypothetical protein
MQIAQTEILTNAMFAGEINMAYDIIKAWTMELIDINKKVNVMNFSLTDRIPSILKRQTPRHA